MANKILLTPNDGTPDQIVFCDAAGDFNPAAANDLRDGTAGNRTTCQLSLASVADGAARQSAKVDLGAKWSRQYLVRAALEFASGLAAGDTCYLYWNPSQSVTAGNGNNGNCSGTDAAYTGYSSNLADSIYHLQFIGAFRMTAQATATIQVGTIGVFSPAHRYGSLVFIAGDDMHSDDVECHIVFDPIIEEVQ